jgi:hypothetical protein
MQAVDAEVERVLAMSDEEIVADCIARGEDPAAIAEECRAIFERAIAAAPLRGAIDAAPPKEDTPTRPAELDICPVCPDPSICRRQQRCVRGEPLPAPRVGDAA